MDHCAHQIDYVRSGDLPPDIIFACCHCGASFTAPLFEMKPLDQRHGTRVLQEAMIVTEEIKEVFDRECVAAD